MSKLICLAVALSALLGGCTQRVAMRQVPGDAVVTLRVRDDLCPPGGCVEDAPADPTCVGGGPDGLAVMGLGAGHGHACVVLSDGSVKCWGANTSGQLGEGTYGRRATPTLVSGLASARSVGAGRAHSCALTSEGTVYCWGGNGYGALGSSAGNMQNTPREVPGLRGVTQLGVGYDHTCAVTGRGQVSCWGRNQMGQIGSGGRDRLPSPTRVPRLQASSVAAGFDSSCAVTTDGAVACWGALAASPRPVVVQGLPQPAVSVEVGEASACARLVDGAVFCWGDGTHGQLGPRVRGASEVAVPVDGLPPANTLTVYANRACVTDVQAQVWCWGSSDGFDVEASAPHVVAMMGPSADCAMGGRAACARLHEGGLCCWGSNIDGMLGAMHQPFANPAFLSELPIPMLW